MEKLAAGTAQDMLGWLNYLLQILFFGMVQLVIGTVSDILEWLHQILRHPTVQDVYISCWDSLGHLGRLHQLLGQFRIFWNGYIICWDSLEYSGKDTLAAGTVQDILEWLHYLLGQFRIFWEGYISCWDSFGYFGMVTLCVGQFRIFLDG